jgi:hypothetical protein
MLEFGPIETAKDAKPQVPLAALRLDHTIVHLSFGDPPPHEARQPTPVHSR